MPYASAGQKRVPRQDWKHECPLSPTEVIPKVNVITKCDIYSNSQWILLSSTHCLSQLISELKNSWSVTLWFHSDETSWSNLYFLPHLSILLLMMESTIQRAETANQRVWRCCALELGAFKQGNSSKRTTLMLAPSCLPCLLRLTTLGVYMA